MICEGLHRWQQRDPIRASCWHIILLGEEFEEPLLYPVQNARIEGKLSLEEYADYLNRASVGVSLMISPHPSYPPLEMAEAGLEIITNAFNAKDLRLRFPNIVSIDHLTACTLSEAIEQTVARRDSLIGAVVKPIAGQIPPLSNGTIAEPSAIACLIRNLVIN
jgi:hypothetical protein